MKEAEERTENRRKVKIMQHPDKKRVSGIKWSLGPNVAKRANPGKRSLGVRL